MGHGARCGTLQIRFAANLTSGVTALTSVDHNAMRDWRVSGLTP